MSQPVFFALLQLGMLHSRRNFEGRASVHGIENTIASYLSYPHGLAFQCRGQVEGRRHCQVAEEESPGQFMK